MTVLLLMESWRVHSGGKFGRIKKKWGCLAAVLGIKIAIGVLLWYPCLFYFIFGFIMVLVVNLTYITLALIQRMLLILIA
jgi:hypothetical protein